MVGLPKSYIKKYGISKRAWREFRKSKSTRKSNPSKKKVKKVTRRRGRYRARRRRRYKPKLPFEVGAALIAIPFTGAQEGWNSPIQAIQNQDWEDLGNQVKSGVLGIDISTGNINIWELLNPFNFNKGRYVKMLIAAGIISKIRKKVVRIPFGKIPLIGKYIS